MKTYDSETTHELLVKAGGDVQIVSNYLNISEEEVFEFATTDTVLAPIWSDRLKQARATKRFASIELPTQTSVIVRENPISPEVATEIQDDWLATKGLAGCGMTYLQIKKAMSFAAFAGKSFAKMVDMGHGMLAVNAMKLHERAEWILDNILSNDETVDREKITPKGDVVVITEPKYSEEEKIKWQGELTSLISEMRKITETTVNAQSVGQKIADLLAKAQDTGGRKTRRLKPLPQSFGGDGGPETIKYNVE